jgi:hypothetical protein
MANTKVTGDLIAGGTITTFNLADGSVTAAKLNSITTDSISEGTNLFYTDARVETYLSGNGYDTATNIIATITDSAPTTLDTLNELAAALGDDPNFATTVTNSIATKLPLAGGTISGSLGIGVASPIGPVDIDANTSALNLNLRSRSGSDFSNITFSTDDGASYLVNIGSIGDSLRILTGGLTSLSEAMRIDASGNVGIGTSSPSSKLQIGDGSSSTYQTIDSSTGGAILFKKAGTNAAFVGETQEGLGSGDGLLLYTYGNGDRPIRFYTNGANERMRITSSGNVGIGTTNPTEKFEVNGSSTLPITLGRFINTSTADTSNKRATIVLGSTDTIGTRKDVVHLSSVVDNSNVISGGLLIATRDSSENIVERMRIDSSGDVSIGLVASDIAQLKVRSNASAKAVLFLDSSALTEDTYTRYAVGSSDGWEVGMKGIGSSYGYVFSYGNISNVSNERMRITNTGNVWINASDSIGRLTVGGSIASSGTATRSGFDGGFGGNTYNINWTGSNAVLYIDNVNIGNIQVSSDYRIKRNIETQTAPALDRITQLRPVIYQRAEYKNLFKADNGVREGFIAHELAEIIPSAVEGKKDAEDQIQSLKLDALCSVMVKSIQELKQIVDNQQRQINDLKAQLNGTD